MQNLNELIKKKGMSRYIRGKGTLVKKNINRKTGCASCSKNFDKNGR
jgi:formate-dependent nitrite reductase cytochrome c552 subunit